MAPAAITAMMPTGSSRRSLGVWTGGEDIVRSDQA
jgi:hypothetical protein